MIYKRQKKKIHHKHESTEPYWARFFFYFFLNQITYPNILVKIRILQLCFNIRGEKKTWTVDDISRNVYTFNLHIHRVCIALQIKYSFFYGQRGLNAQLRTVWNSQQFNLLVKTLILQKQLTSFVYYWVLLDWWYCVYYSKTA